MRSTSATSPSGVETSFVKTSAANAKPFALGENFRFETSRMVSSQINETNEQSGEKSFNIDLTLSTKNPNLSPVIDLDRASVNLIANRINNIDVHLMYSQLQISTHQLNQMVTRILRLYT